ncbi:MAG: serine acetyltransferase [Oscillospiraceae bacterium]|nr:serine acetyltransferase [Oscillospiraceae bacterium]
MILRVRERIINFSRGDDLRGFWHLFYFRKKAKNRLFKDMLGFSCSRSAHRHGGYVGIDADIKGIPSLPHGLHGVFISRYSSIGAGCRIYQNVTIGEKGQKAPCIGRSCLIGAGAVLIGDIKIGDNVKIGAGAVVFTDIPDNSTVVSQAPRILIKESEGEQQNA